MTGILISAAHKSSGKTTLSIGLAATLKKHKKKVQTFKKGPDYIDAHWLQRASGRHCYNLDFNTMSIDEIKQLYVLKQTDADISIVEANKGLYDGLHVDGRDSNAALAQHLGLPVVLVLDCAGVTRGIAPLLLGYQGFDKNINIAGVILNKVATARHERKLLASIKTYTNIPVIGVVYSNPDLQIIERQLGLIPENEQSKAGQIIENIATVVAAGVNLNRFVEIANTARKSKSNSCTNTAVNITTSSQNKSKPDLRLGIFSDAAFGFYYPDDLEALQAGGAELIKINPLKDSSLPAVDALFIGGGFPESHAEQLQQNHKLRSEVKAEIENGIPVYAECGGLMYLCNKIICEDKEYAMAGSINADVRMHQKPQGRGYTILEATENYPWKNPHKDNQALMPAHEFHYSSLENIDPNIQYAYSVKRGYGIDGKHDGIVYKNCFASFSHLRNTAENHWCDKFISFIRENIT